MQNKNEREQPMVVSSEPQPVVAKDEAKGKQELTEGSLLGKFKDIKSLTEAYANLQSEFTRKSQKLSEYEKSDNLQSSKTGANKAESNKHQVLEKENTHTTAISDNNLKLKEVATKTESKTANTSEKVDIQAIKQGSDNETSLKTNSKPLDDNNYFWQKQVEEFLTKNPTAKNFAQSIVEEIYNDKDLKQNNRSLEIAYSRVLAKKYKPENELVEDESFLNNHIYNNKKITQKIVLNYLNGLKNSNTPPVIVGSKGAHLGVGMHSRPQNLNEAKEIFEKMLKKQ